MKNRPDKNDSWIIRKAEKSDLEAICHIETANFPSDRLSPRQMRYHIKNPKALFLIAASPIDKTPLGYILVFFRQNGPARIYSITSRKDMQNKGLGRALLNRACEEIKARDYRKALLEVRHKDQDIVRFYESAGFTKIKDLPAYYEDGADGIKMQKLIGSLKHGAIP